MVIRQLDKNIFVGEQITIENLKELKELGFKVIINNRPDGEDYGQIRCSDLKQAAHDIGLEFYHIPLSSMDGITDELLDSMRNSIDGKIKTFCFCRSGTRSTMLWALSQKGKKSPDEIIRCAESAGYDIGHLRETLEN